VGEDIGRHDRQVGPADRHDPRNDKMKQTEAIRYEEGRQISAPG
jgi:hypothetical protein